MPIKGERAPAPADPSNIFVVHSNQFYRLGEECETIAAEHMARQTRAVGEGTGHPDYRPSFHENQEGGPLPKTLPGKASETAKRQEWRRWISIMGREILNVVNKSGRLAWELNESTLPPGQESGNPVQGDLDLTGPNATGRCIGRCLVI